MKTINLNRNQFTGTGMGYVIQKIGEHKNDNNIQMEVLDLSECNLNDDALETLSPIVDVVKELSLNDNQFTRLHYNYLYLKYCNIPAKT